MQSIPLWVCYTHHNHVVMRRLTYTQKGNLWRPEHLLFRGFATPNPEILYVFSSRGKIYYSVARQAKEAHNAYLGSMTKVG